MTRLFAVLISLSLALTAPFARANEPTPPALAARAWLLYDVGSGQVLTAQGADERIEPASLTKLMTAYVTFSALKAKTISMDQQVAVSENARKSSLDGSRMFIMPGMPVTVRELIQGMIVQSGNDATMALAEGVGGSAERFVQLMNEQAKAMGLAGTQYRNPEGLTEPGHHTTARDLATLSTRLLRDFPEYLHYYTIRKYRYPGTPASNDTNRNTLLFRDPTVDGLKTGHTSAAGYCLVATARRDFPNLPGRRLLSVVLGASSETARANESQKLLNWGYTAYEAVKLFDGGQPVASPKVWKGKSAELKLGRGEPIVVAVPSGSAGQIKTEIARPEPLIAPFRQGQAVATLKVRQGEQTLAEVPLVALEAVEEAGFLGRAWDAMRLWIK